MRLTLFIIMLTASLLHGQEQINIPLEFQISKTHCLLNFMETIAGERQTSPSLLQVFEQSKLVNDRQVNGLIDAWNNLDLEIQYELNGYPEGRKGYRSLKEHLEMYAARSNDMDDFEEMTLGLYSNSTQQQVLAILQSIEPFYDSLIWVKNLPAFQARVDSIRSFAAQHEMADLLKSIKVFYGAQWPNGSSFKISLYPIPGKVGNPISTPRSDMLLCGMLIDNNNYPGLLGIALHEIAHTFYQEQPRSVQWEWAGYFENAPSQYSSFAYSYLNEALATAIGNGWVFEKLSGKLDPDEWYTDRYINGYAKAIFPLVKMYLDSEISLDEAFVDQAINIFEETFPLAIFEYQNLFNDFSMFADIRDDQINDLLRIIQDRFRSSSYFISTPILNPESLDRAEKSEVTRVFVLTDNVRQTLGRLESLIPELKKYEILNPDRPFLLRFLTEEKKAVIIIHTNRDLKAFQKALEFIKMESRINIMEPLIWLDD